MFLKGGVFYENDIANLSFFCKKKRVELQLLTQPISQVTLESEWLDYGSQLSQTAMIYYFVSGAVVKE